MRARIRTTDYDGNAVEVEGVFAGWGDQIAFERRFGVNAAVLGRLRESFDDEGGLLPGADPAAIKSEWLAYLAWRVVARGPAAGTDFETWLEGVADLDVAVEDAEDETTGAAPVPTIAIATAQPSS